MATLKHLGAKSGPAQETPAGDAFWRDVSGERFALRRAAAELWMTQDALREAIRGSPAVASKLGSLAAFSAGGQRFADADLASCNAAAAPAVASAAKPAETAAR